MTAAVTFGRLMAVILTALLGQRTTSAALRAAAPFYHIPDTERYPHGDGHKHNPYDNPLPDHMRPIILSKNSFSKLGVRRFMPCARRISSIVQ